jgi:hypothetical protein
MRPYAILTAVSRPIIAFAACFYLAGFAGCATAPVPHQVERTQTYAQDEGVIWQRAVAFFADRNLSIQTIDKASGIIAVDRQITTPVVGILGYADCGNAPLMRKIAQTIDMNVFVRPIDDHHTSVTVNTRFTETQILGYNILTERTLACISTGKMEDEILTALRRSL